LPHLEILSVQTNRIIKIENLLNLKNLQELYLSDNGLTKIEGLEGLTKLRVIDLSNNQIERIENIKGLNELEEFWFSNNNLAHWEDIDLFKELPKLRCLYMEMNPIYYENNTKPLPGSFTSTVEKINSSYRRKIMFALPNLKQLDASLCVKSSLTPSV
jgi:protein phosphatase 1 regulatory subunit 7